MWLYNKYLLVFWYLLLFKESLRFFIGVRDGFEGAFRPLSDMWVGFWPSDFYWGDSIIMISLCIFWIWMIRWIMGEKKREAELDGNR